MSSYSTSSNTSSTSPVETTENGLIDQLSGVALGLANQMNSWAQQTYAQTSQVTDQAVNNFFNASNQMTSLATNMTNQYNTLFAPENAQLVQDANDYASTAHMQADMGMAGATQAQAGDAAVKNSEANLVSMGIDPSSGRYAALDKAAAVQNSANVAGAENMQRQQDIQTGQNLRAEAVQVGAQLPASIANATNTAISANIGASNASLANANTGANLNSLADKYLQTAMGIKLPASQSKSSGSSQSTSSKPESNSSNGGGQGGSGSGGGQGSAGLGNPGMGPNTAAQGGSGSVGGQPGSKFLQPNASQQSTNDQSANAWGSSDPTAGTDYSQWDGSNNIYQPDSSGSQLGYAPGASDPTQYLDSNPFNSSGFGDTLPQDNSGFGGADQTFGSMGGGTDTQFGNISYDPSQNQPAVDTSNWGNYSVPTDPTGGWTDPNAGGDTSTYTDPNASSSYDNSSGSSDNSGYAGGGAIQPGGVVPQAASPSGGQRTDDVRANLNADEFVVPKDVAKWKGQEFFHNLIAQSRDKQMKMRAALGTGGKPMPPGDPRAQGRPTFQSRGV